MGEKKWTPGPWVTVRFVDDDDDIFTIGHKRGGIARMILHSQKQKDDAAANARLIAAAPELYEALYGLMHGHDGSIEAAQAALAKARGEK